MSEVRHPHREEQEALVRLWEMVFGDGENVVRSFFRVLYDPERAYVIEQNGEIVSMAFALLFGEARYIYGVATHPDYRGRGYGKAVTLAAAEGQPSYLNPASEGLRGWYARELGARTICNRAEWAEPTLLHPLSIEEYNARREVLLADVPHASYSLAVLRYSEETGGRFYKTANGICAVESEIVREALPCAEGTTPFVMGLNGAPPLYWGLALE